MVGAERVIWWQHLRNKIHRFLLFKSCSSQVWTIQLCLQQVNHTCVLPLITFSSLLYYLNILPPIWNSLHSSLGHCDFSVNLTILSSSDLLELLMSLFFIPGQLPICMVIIRAELHHLKFTDIALWPPLFAKVSSTYWYLESNNPIRTFWSIGSMTFSVSFIPSLWPHISSYMNISPDPIF